MLNLLDLVDTPEGAGYVSMIEYNEASREVSYRVHMGGSDGDPVFPDYSVCLVRRTRCACDRRDHLLSRGGPTFTTQLAWGELKMCPCGTVNEILAGAAKMMTMADVAAHLNLSLRTVQDYRLDGRMPPATMVGRTPTWTRAQIDQWQATRPGQGARTDLR